VARQGSPWQRLTQSSTGSADIINPARLDAARGSEVCGQCHAYFLPNDPDEWWEHGFTQSYRPGDELAASRRLLSFERGAPERDPALSASLSSLFYADGTVRVGGREWNGLSRSACFTRGRGDRQIACTSCHGMHAGAADDQLQPGDVDAPCRGCHEDLAPNHSRHAPLSSGDSCVSCHMPKTTYALFKSIRSHRITRPQTELDPGLPLNACNLCHQDRSLAWTRDWLDRWYPSATPTGSAEEAAHDGRHDMLADAGRSPEAAWSALAVAALSGDAAARVIAVAALGDASARAASAGGWQSQVLAEALDDPYAAVRFVAARSLRAFPGFAELELVFDAPRAERLRQQTWARQRAAGLAAASPALPTDAAGLIQRSVLDALIGQRDLSPVRIAE
jgi:predicted CXXCH cytochrome family protein